jgi:hypothetical protein
MSTDPAAMVKEGVRLFKANKKAEARSIWEQVTELDPYNEQAWLWLSAVVDSVEDQRVCLENVLYINPDNPNAKKGLATLDAKNPSASGATSSRPAGTAPLSTTPPIATSSASSTFMPETTSPEVYDDWIGSLNLPGTGNLDSSPSTASSGTSSGKTKKPATNPFTTTDFDNLDSYDTTDTDGNIFDNISDQGDSFEIYTPSPKETTGASYSSGDDLRAMMSMDDDDDDRYLSPSSSASRPSSAAAFTSTDSYSYDDSDDDDDVFGDDFSIYTPPGPAASTTRANEYDLGDDPFGDNPFPNAVPSTSSQTSSSPFTSDDLDFDTDAVSFSTSGSAYGIASDDDPDPGEYFAMIPDTIRARPLPGSDEKYPVLLRLMFILLLLLNMGAIVLLVVQLAG